MLHLWECDSLISALKLLVNLQEKESLIDVVCGGTKIWWREEHGAQRQFTEIEWESAFENSLDNIFITIIL